MKLKATKSFSPWARKVKVKTPERAVKLIIASNGLEKEMQRVGFLKLDRANSKAIFKFYDLH